MGGIGRGQGHSRGRGALHRRWTVGTSAWSECLSAAWQGATRGRPQRERQTACVDVDVDDARNLNLGVSPGASWGLGFGAYLGHIWGLSVPWVWGWVLASSFGAKAHEERDEDWDGNKRKGGIEDTEEDMEGVDGGRTDDAAVSTDTSYTQLGVPFRVDKDLTASARQARWITRMGVTSALSVSGCTIRCDANTTPYDTVVQVQVRQRHQHRAGSNGVSFSGRCVMRSSFRHSLAGRTGQGRQASKAEREASNQQPQARRRQALPGQTGHDRARQGRQRGRQTGIGMAAVHRQEGTQEEDRKVPALPHGKARR